MSHQLSLSNPIVITNCTARKRATGRVVSLRVASKAEKPAKLAMRWVASTSNAPSPNLAGEFYVGRAISEAKATAKLLSADLYFVSAGLGLVHQSDKVPNYNLTVSSSQEALPRALAATDSSPSAWWNALTRLVGSINPIARMIEVSCERLFLIALPSTYLRLVQEDLAQVSIDSASRVRIFTSQAGASIVPERIRSCVLPYDERLESLSGFAGTRNDFPQRALRHFIEIVNGREHSLNDAHSAVTAALSKLRLRQLPLRQKRTDEQISSLLEENWLAHSGSSTRLLRFLRDDAQVACEQSRFRELWRGVQLSRNCQSGKRRAA